MKKLLFGILTILGIGFSFCSADSCSSNINICSFAGINCTESCNSYRQVFSLYFDTVGQYSVDGFTYYNSFGSDLSGLPLYACPISEYGSYSWTDYVYDNCELVSYTISNVSTNNYLVSLDDSYIIDSSSTPYLTFVFIGDERNCSNINILYYNWDYPGLNIPLDSIVYYKSSSSQGPYLQPTNVCYSVFGSTPKFKVNYGNTSYEYELNDNLSIYLKSPVIQNGNTFIYNGSTGLNLFFNGTSQWYDKSNLYLESMFWYNNNIFTPICL